MHRKDSPHVYVECDVPEGQTLAEFHAARCPRKPRWFRRWFGATGGKDRPHG